MKGLGSQLLDTEGGQQRGDALLHGALRVAPDLLWRFAIGVRVARPRREQQRRKEHPGHGAALAFGKLSRAVRVR